MIRVSICLSDLPKDKITTASNNKKYLELIVDERREPDQYGNTHYVYVSQSKEEREAKTGKLYVGNGKEHKFTNSPKPPAEEPQHIKGKDEPDDLPF